MDSQPRNPDGSFMDIDTVEAECSVKFLISEFECRVIGDRLNSAAKRLSNLHGNMDCQLRMEQDCRYWSKKFLSACATREKHDEEYHENGQKRHIDALYPVKVSMTDFECWSMGNRLYEIGTWFEKKKNCERVAAETKWLARRFHAEKKEQE